MVLTANAIALKTYKANISLQTVWSGSHVEQSHDNHVTLTIYPFSLRLLEIIFICTIHAYLRTPSKVMRQFAIFSLDDHINIIYSSVLFSYLMIISRLESLFTLSTHETMTSSDFRTTEIRYYRSTVRVMTKIYYTNAVY